jgi:ABC-type uncharacterized transport system permease subunit
MAPGSSVTSLFVFRFHRALTIPLANIKTASGENVPVQFVQIIPYVLTIIVLAGFIGFRAPRKHWEIRIEGKIKEASYRLASNFKFNN